MPRLEIAEEVVPKRAFAWAVEWPGWCRGGRTPLLAREALLAAAPSYAEVARAAGLVLSEVTDVDLHVVDARGDQAFAQDVVLDSGGELIADVSNGFGPECVTIPGSPAYVAKAKHFRMKEPELGIDVDIEGRNAIQGKFRFEHEPAAAAA